MQWLHQFTVQHMQQANQRLRDMGWKIAEVIARQSQQHTGDLQRIYEAVQDFGAKYTWLHGQSS